MTVTPLLQVPNSPPAAIISPVAGMECRLDTNLDSLSPFRTQWDECVLRTGGDIYFTYDWCRTWLRHYGRGRETCILSFWHGPRMTSLLPMVLETVWAGPIPVRLAKLLGSDSTTVVLNPPVADQDGPAAYAAALERLLDDERCDAAWFGPLAGHRPHRQVLREACTAPGRGARVIRDLAIGVHTIFDLPETFEEYLAGLDKQQRGNYRRDLRHLERVAPVHVDCVDDPTTLEEGFREFLSLHETQWRSQGQPGHFGDWPGAVAFNRDLIRTMAPLDRLRFERMCVGRQVAAWDYSFRLNDWLYWRLPARRVGEPWDKMGLGRVSLVARIEAAYAAGIRHIEAGAGHYEYKVRLGAAEYPLGSVLIAGPASKVAKARLLSRWADLLHLLYYRVWFSRIAPSLPMQRRPLWRSWIRAHM